MGPGATFIGRRQERAIWSSLKWLLEESTHRDEAEEDRVRMQSGPVTALLRYLRRTNPGGAIEYVGQLLGGLIHPQLLRSGATPEDEHRPLPGDDLVPGPVWQATRALTIDAPAAQVWPWRTTAVRCLRLSVPRARRTISRSSAAAKSSTSGRRSAKCRTARAARRDRLSTWWKAVRYR